MSKARLSELAAMCNAITHMEMISGTTNDWNIIDGKLVLQIRDGTGEPTTAGGGGGVNPRGEYDADTDYLPLDAVYTAPDSATRFFWICEIANGPSTSVHAPTFPEPGTIYWRCYSRSGGPLMYRIKSVEDDYLVCRTWNGTSEGGSDVNVAKQYKLRTSISSENIFGTSHTYTYSNYASVTNVDGSGGSGSGNRVRHDDDGSTTEDQMVIPIWNLNDIIFAAAATTGVTVGGNDVGLIQQSDSRQWAYLT